MKNHLPFRELRLLCLMALLFTKTLPAQDSPGGKKPLVVAASLFPQYDFARRIGGERAVVSLLLPPGADPHAFDPKPSDLAGVAKADIFAYAGADLEPWAEKLLAAVGGSGGPRAVDISAGMPLLEIGEDDDDGDDGEHRPSESEGGGRAEHAHARDPHVWLDPVLAESMVDALLAAMREADPENAAHYTANAAVLREDLRRLDAECRELVAGARRRVLVFGGKFAFAYFARRYGLEHVGAYDSCGSGAEPSVRRIVEITDYVGKNRIPVVYHEEFAEPRISAVIAGATGCALRTAHSLHNLSAAELASGVGFTEMMRRNLAAFAEGLR